MSRYTCFDELDLMFTVDTDEMVDSMGIEGRVMSYGGNSLHPPKRALSQREAELIDDLGAPE